MNIKVFTTKKHRFGRQVNIVGQTVQVDAEGYAEIPEELVSQALLVGFELVDKNVKFTTDEERQHVAEINDILDTARKEAETIIAEAKKEAGVILIDANVDERRAKKEELENKKVDELRALCVDAGVPEDKWKGLKKAELVDFIISLIFDEE